MRLERYVGSLRGVRAVANSDEVSSILRRKAEAVANAARARHQIMSSDDEPGPGPEVPLPIKVEKSSSGVWNRYVVIADHPGAQAAEAKNRILGGALDAAGG